MIVHAIRWRNDKYCAAIELARYLLVNRAAYWLRRLSSLAICAQLLFCANMARK